MEFHERVKKLRLERKVSQAEMARVLGIAQSVYARYETGDRKPSYETLVSLAAYFGVSTDYLLGKSDQLRPGEAAAASSSVAYEDLPPEVLEKLESYKLYLLEEYRKSKKE